MEDRSGKKENIQNKNRKQAKKTADEKEENSKQVQKRQ